VPIMARASAEAWSSAYTNRLPAIGGKQKALGLQVRALRQAKGWTLEEAAGRATWI